jgi:GT2 family glycosyltransferase
MLEGSFMSEYESDNSLSSISLGIDGVVVVLSWFGKGDTIECVRSLMQDPCSPHVLVVDNGSFDGVLEEVSIEWPGVSTLQTGENLGFAGGMNRGIQWALDHGATYITVLNNDTIVPVGALARSQDLAIGRRAVSPTIYYRDRPTDIWFAGGTLDRSLMYSHHTPISRLQKCEGGIRRTQLLAGCCVTASAEIWRTVGLFDERFFLNFEDSEWSMRASAAGVELIIDCSTRILHAVSASFVGAAGYLGTFYFVRNGLLFNRLSGGSLASRGRFLRHKGLLAVAASSRAGDRRRAVRQAVLVATAVACYLLGRFGAAPRSTQRMVAGWRV